MSKEKTYRCPDCETLLRESEMRREYDFGYDQSCCLKCGDVLIDNLRGNTYYTEPLSDEQKLKAYNFAYPKSKETDDEKIWAMTDILKGEYAAVTIKEMRDLINYLDSLNKPSNN